MTKEEQLLKSKNILFDSMDHLQSSMLLEFKKLASLKDSRETITLSNRQRGVLRRLSGKFDD